MTIEKMQLIFAIRRSIGDPVTSDLIFVDELPETAQENIAYSTGNGEYKYFDRVQWRNYTLKFSDTYILSLSKRGRISASLQLINNLIARIDPTDYITSGNAGGQSMSFLSLSEVLLYYETLRNTLLEEQAAESGTNSGLMLSTKRRAVGGVLESYE